MQYPNTVIGTVLRLSASFVNRETNALITMTGGSAAVRVTNAAGSVVLDAACTISGTTVYYDWDTAAQSEGQYHVQFSATSPSGTLFFEPFDPITVQLRARIGA